MQFFLHLGLLNCSGVNYVELDYIADYWTIILFTILDYIMLHYTRLDYSELY